MKRVLILLAAAAFLFGMAPLQAQDDYGQYSAQQPPNAQPAPPPNQAPPSNQSNTPTDADPNAPGMARVSVVQGSVSTQRGDNGDWVPVTVNTPVAVGDRISTGTDGRAEIQLDYADVLRLSSNTTAKIAQINRNTIQVQVGQGLASYTVMKDAQATPEIDTPNAALHPNGPGEFRIVVDSDAESEITVRNGSADVTTPQGSTHVDAGQLITVAGTDNPEYKTSTAPAEDAWDKWNDDRNSKIENAQSWRNTDQYYTGSGDLDGHGTWSEVPDYGPVWIPSEGPDWAPYRDGRWVYEPYYGWTWVSYEPWGWAPYHYGRWFMWNNSWAWWPGPVYYNPYYYPVWAPAYVSFFGWGGGGWGFGVGFGYGGWGFGRIGWLPCGPGDWYHPWWGRWGRGYNFVNVHDGFRGDHNGFGPLMRNGRGFSNFNEAMHNDHVRAGFSSMNGHDFGRAAVSMHQDRISTSQFNQARMVGGRMPVSPTRASYSPTGRAADPRSFRSAPPASQHFFSDGNRASAGSFNRNSGTQSFNRGNGSFGSANTNRGNSRGAITSSRPGWHTFTPPQAGNSRSEGFQGNRGATNTGRGSFGAGNNSRGGWQRFTPQARGSSPSFSGRGNSGYGENGQRGYQGQADPYRGAYGGYSNGRSGRPTLNMRQPVVQPRGGYGRSPYGGSPYGGSRGYNAPRGNYSAPRGGYSAPRGNYSAPRGGGGGYRGGGGGGSRGGGGGSHGGGGGRR